MAKQTKKYTEEFKKQIVALHIEGGHKPAELAREYGIAPSSVSKWVRDFRNIGFFKGKDNRTLEEEGLLKLRKENKLEVDILKQVALKMA